jgi:tRNA-splicing ligase RtcB (3'-phosphate/5'-hydroxy nucleic acid ligase)
METISVENGVPLLLWVKDIEDGAMRQAKNVASLPFAFHHVALMPDAHEGYGMPIGGVFASRDMIIPNAVGVDIGCGMCAVKTNMKEDDPEVLKKIMRSIRARIPLGFSHNKNKQDEILMPWSVNPDNTTVVKREYNAALYQLGTLGGGNHFIEIQKDTDDFLWIMIHSGSRNIGLKVAEHYHKQASLLNEKEKNEQWYHKDLAFLHIDSNEGKAYIDEMNYCVEFAFQNRNLMMNTIVEIFSDFYFGNILFEKELQIAHNYARKEEHFGEEVYVHRKGATSAAKGETGIIPGSQGTSSYIVEGLGNPLSFMSCSHGAGRKMGRKEAQRSLNLEDEISKLDKQGILHGIRGKHDLDEATGAYKNIDIVMENQKDLVKIKTKLRPIAVIKG